MLSGTNLVFGASARMRVHNGSGYHPFARRRPRPLRTQSIVNGFKTVIDLLPEPPAAISFAFPGPADYKNGIVGGFLPTSLFPQRRSPSALSSKRSSGLPVFINNDGDLFAFGEAMAERCLR